MCWIEVPNRLIGEEVQARLDADPRAVAITTADRSVARGVVSFLVAFGAGVLAGLLW